jgi:hypothetical protein
MEPKPSLSVLPSRLSITIGTSENPYFQAHLVFPEIRFILTDDQSRAGQKREILSLTLQDVFVERQAKTGTKLLRVLDYK